MCIRLPLIQASVALHRSAWIEIVELKRQNYNDPESHSTGVRG